MDITYPSSIDNQSYLNSFYALMEKIKANAESFPSYVPILPLCFHLNGKPYGLKKYFVFEPFFKRSVPTTQVWKTGRQVSKSTSSAAESILRASMTPHYNILHVTPYNDMITRFSGNYIYDFLQYSPVRSFFLGDHPLSKKQVTFRNGSRLMFSFASDDCTRIRGINAHCVHYDEWQDMDPSFEPEINATTAAADFPIFQKTGTPKTLDNPMESAWQRSSQAEWVIPCSHCGKFNEPSAESQQLEKMIGPQTPKWEISARQPGLCCAHCGKWLYPSQGHWVHRFAERRWDAPGYHVPQIIMPMHCESPSKWNLLLSFKAGANNTTEAKFYNEICGISYDEGAKLITITDLKKVATIPIDRYEDDSIDKAVDYIHQRGFVDVALGVDWGGGGVEETSFTVVAVVCLTASGNIEVPWAWRSLTPNEPVREAARVKWLFYKFGASHIAHDFIGSGTIREIVMINMNLDDNFISPMSYTRTTAGPLFEKKTNVNSNVTYRKYYSLQKAKSIVLLCSAIKAGKVRFFHYDFRNTEQAGLLHDFMSLIEEKLDGRGGSDTYHVIRNPKLGPDDFVHAVNYGAMSLYNKHKCFPDVSLMAQSSLFDGSEEQLQVSNDSFFS